MMRLLTAAALAASLAPLVATGAEAQEARPPRPVVAVVVVPLNDARHGQIKHGRRVLETLGDERFLRSYRLVEPTISVDELRQCEDESPERGLDFCARFSLNRALSPDSGPHVVVAFDDRRADASTEHGDEEMRVLCFGRGAIPADPAAQDTWLWTNSGRMHGVQHWQRDRDALADCIDAAMSEPPGTPRPKAY